MAPFPYELFSGSKLRLYEIIHRKGKPLISDAGAIACKKNRTSNIEHRTPNAEQGILPIYKWAERSESIVRRSMLNVRCSMFKRHAQVPGQGYIRLPVSEPLLP
jgi:hypothetical protein